MSRTTIEWCAVPGTIPESWNPVKGCSPIAAGCANCYAARMTRRLEAMGQRAYVGLLNKDKGHFNGTVFCDERELDRPSRWRKPRTVFVCSMSDLYHRHVPDAFIDRVMVCVAANPQHTFIFLTKRHARMRADTFGRPSLQNRWCMVSVSTQMEYVSAIDAMVDASAVVRGLSIEPLLGRIVLGARLKYLDWVIVGAESKGAYAGRMCEYPWMVSIVDECRQLNVPVFVKQLQIHNRINKNPAEWRETLRVREYPRVGED